MTETIPDPINEPIRSYAPSSSEREALKRKLEELKSTQVEIPLIIGGKEIKTGVTGTCVMPHNHKHVLATYHKAGEKEVKMAIKSSLDAWKDWSSQSLEYRAEFFLKMAKLGHVITP